MLANKAVIVGLENIEKNAYELILQLLKLFFYLFTVPLYELGEDLAPWIFHLQPVRQVFPQRIYFRNKAL
jgi:hypothetical protein